VYVPADVVVTFTVTPVSWLVIVTGRLVPPRRSDPAPVPQRSSGSSARTPDLKATASKPLPQQGKCFGSDYKTSFDQHRGVLFFPTNHLLPLII